MIIKENDLIGKFASPKNHPITCANPKPWRIEEVKIEVKFDGQTKVWIRNRHSMWFRSDQCWVGTEQELIDNLSITKKDLEERNNYVKEANQRKLV